MCMVLTTIIWGIRGTHSDYTIESTIYVFHKTQKRESREAPPHAHLCHKMQKIK